MTGQLATFCGPNIEAISPGMARLYCQENGLGFCHVIGEIVSVIPCDENYNADFKNAINYNLQLN